MMFGWEGGKSLVSGAGRIFPPGSSPSGILGRKVTQTAVVSKLLMGSGMGSGMLNLVLACIDKWVNSKFEDATPPALCSGPKLAIWNKNQPPRPEKTPGHGEKSKMAILVLFGSRRSLGEKETDLYNDSCPTVFNLYDIHTPQTPARHP